MSVTVVSCIYGDGYGRFVSEWDHAIGNLDPRPDDVLVLADRHYPFSNAQLLIATNPGWRHPQAFYQQVAVDQALTDWVWIVDIDDRAMSDGLRGLDEVVADVWQLGYERSDGVVHIPPRLTNDQYLEAKGNPYVAGSMIRREAVEAVGGFDDIALQDWGLWRKLARAGATFEPSDRTHFHYVRHPATRGETELTLDARVSHLAEMFAVEEGFRVVDLAI